MGSPLPSGISPIATLQPLSYARTAGASSAVGTRLSLALVAYAKTNVDTKSPQGFAPIHAAVRLPSLPIAKALIGRRADLDSVDGSGSAALHLAIAMDGKAPGKAYEPIAVALVEGKRTFIRSLKHRVSLSTIKNTGCDTLEVSSCSTRLKAW